ncbi:hypothetical protein KM043_013922 [Ampulex compressa]|nr:hypothetical protein KM043_013922 [Ampulex compressa]
MLVVSTYACYTLDKALFIANERLLHIVNFLTYKCYCSSKMMLELFALFYLPLLVFEALTHATLTDDKNIIGPGNSLDENKYNYEVLTGQLFIRGVSTAESGFYKCVSRGIADNSAINVNVVELVVKKDWEDVWENDFETNLLRGMAAVMVVVLLVAIILLIVTMKRRRINKFFDLEESRENSPVRYAGHISTVNAEVPSTPEENGLDNVTPDIDFPRVFKQMQKEHAIP